MGCTGLQWAVLSCAGLRVMWLPGLPGVTGVTGTTGVSKHEKKEKEEMSPLRDEQGKICSATQLMHWALWPLEG